MVCEAIYLWDKCVGEQYNVVNLIFIKLMLFVDMSAYRFCVIQMDTLTLTLVGPCKYKM